MEENKYNNNENQKEEREKEERYIKALSVARDINIVENVMIRTVTMQMSFSALMLGLEKGDYVVPGFQRMYRWSEEQVEELAVSLVKGMPIPPVYCYRNSEQQIVVLDGQQRLLSLYFYYIGKFLKRKRNVFIDFRKISFEGNKFKGYLEQWGLKDKKFVMSYEDEEDEIKELDITYNNLTDRVKRKIDFNPITLVEINVDSEKYKERTLHKIFANLNIGGTPLSRQELRNGIYNCDFYEMLYEINDKSEKWRYIYNGKRTKEINKESKDVETLLQMCAFDYYIEGEYPDFVLKKYKGKVSVLLDEFSQEAKKFDEKEILDYKEKLLDFLDSLEAVSGKSKVSALVSFFAIWNRLDNKPFISKEKCQKIVNSEEYKSTTSSGTSGRNEIEKRLRSVYEQLSKDD